jgi:hypothetical protein
LGRINAAPTEPIEMWADRLLFAGTPDEIFRIDPSGV